MVLRIMLLLLIPLAAHAQSNSAQEYPWTRVPVSELDKFEVQLGDVRVNNFALERASHTAPTGTATAHEFSASIANRSKVALHVLVQVIGVKQDATPTLSSEGNVDVEIRHNDILRFQPQISRNKL